jgi:hypothetical protein
MPEPKTLDEIAEIWWNGVRYEDLILLAKHRFRAALTEAYDLGRANERKALREWANEQYVEIDERRKSGSGDHPGWFFHQLEGKDAAINNLLAALDAREKGEY